MAVGVERKIHLHRYSVIRRSIVGTVPIHDKQSESSHETRYDNKMIRI